MTSLTGLNALTSIGERLTIRSNNVLTSLSGLDNIDYTSLSELVLESSSLLSVCNVKSICEYLAIPSNVAFISGNATGCTSRVEVEEACDANCLGLDDDCDGVANPCDLCPGGDDTIDNNSDGLPDCKYPPAFPQIIPAWKCGGAKVYICHDGTIQCIHKNDLASHIAHGDYLGPCDNSSCNQEPISIGENSLTGIMDKFENLMLEENRPVTIHPNPAAGEAWLDLSAFDGVPCNVKLTNLRGALLHTMNVEAGWDSPVRLDLSGLSPGIYFIQVLPESVQGEVVKIAVGR